MIRGVWRSIGTGVAIVLVAAACQSTASPAPSAGGGGAAVSPAASGGSNLPVVRYGLPTASYFITTVGVHYALDNGYFEQQGIKVEVTLYNGTPTAARALLSNQADIVDVGGDTPFLLWTSGGPIKIIYSPIAGQTGVLVARAGIKSVADLAGKKIAIGAPNDPVQTTITIELRKAGIDPANVTWVPISGGPTARLTALLAGQVDATGATILILKPILDAIAAGQASVLEEDHNVVPDVPTSFDITTDQYIKDHPDLIQKFITAEMMGYRWAQTHPTEAAQIAGKYITSTPADLLLKGMQGISALNVYGVDGGFSLDTIQKSQDQLKELGEITKTAKPEDVADPSFIQKAAQQLGQAPTPAPSS